MKSSPKSFESLFSASEQTEELWTELAIAEFTEELVRWMDIKGMSRADLAKALQSSQPYVTKALKGDVNFTLSSMVKLSRALGLRLRFQLAPEESCQTDRQPRDAAETIPPVYEDDLQDGYRRSARIAGSPAKRSRSSRHKS